MKKIISDDYKKQLEELHATNSAFGKGNVTAKHYPAIEAMIKKHQFESVLDYGCGKGHFIKHLSEIDSKLKTSGFDVANDEFATLSDDKFDLVVSLDVMEHVEFGLLGNVLAEISERTNKMFFCSVANYPAGKKLPDGRNAHVTQMPFGQWFNHFSLYFKVVKFVRTKRSEAIFVCKPMSGESDWR
jgi:2-polyprenyl-3-methyl-5-hydroxy-6-metoxy-1,4-benzoquinol methylase